MLACARPTEPNPALPADALPAVVVAAARALASGDPQAAYLYLPSAAAARARDLRAALPSWAEVFYATKANAFGPVLDALAAEIDGFEVSSTGELAAAVSASASAGRLPRVAASGPGKTPALLHDLVHVGVDVVNLESALEVERVAAAARRAQRRVRVAVRVNPDRVPLSGALQMGGLPSQFGVAEPDVPAVLELARRQPELDVVGFHVHAVSGNLDAATHVAYVRWCLEWSAQTAAACGVDLRVVDVGGGLGVPFDGGAPFDLEELRVGLAALEPPPGVRVLLEPGRFLAAPCGWYAAPVTDLKHSRGSWYAVLRGGIHHFALPASWDLVHQASVVPVDEWDGDLRRPEVRDGVVTVVGELCTPEDTLAQGLGIDVLRAGDVLVFPNAGSYGWEFALQQFLGHPPARRLVVDTRTTPEGAPPA
jgi:diaminopimelate decarboxylase